MLSVLKKGNTAMDDYKDFVFYDKLVSPVNGHECARLMKHNIEKFGFTSISNLHYYYPNFPTCCQAYLDKKNSLLEIKEKEKKEKYSISPNLCTNCKKPLPFEKKHNKFCSSSCSTSCNNKIRGFHSEETKTKIREKLAGKSKPKSKTICNVQFKHCECCKSLFTLRSHGKHSRKTCSSVCKNELIRASAVSQKRHGGGKRGIYKGIRCDSTWELAYLIYHLDHGYEIERCTEKRKYIKNKVVRTYTPDFKTKEGLIEIKGFMSKTADLKLKYNPDVILIDKKNIGKYIDYVKNKYKCNKIEDLYDKKDYKIKFKNCLKCNNKFELKSKKQKYCSPTCASTSPKSEDHRKKISIALSKNKL